MGFEITQARTPTNIGDIQVLLEVKAGGQESVEYTVHVLDQEGRSMGPKQGDLAPHLTATQINGLKALMVSVRTKAQKLIPGE